MSQSIKYNKGKPDSHLVDLFLTFLVLTLFCFTLLNACMPPDDKSAVQKSGTGKTGAAGNPTATPTSTATGIPSVGLTRPTVNTDLKDNDVSNEDIQLLIDILNFTQNKLEAAWQGARAKEKRADKVNPSDTLKKSVFGFTLNLLDTKKVILRKEDVGVEAGNSTKFVMRKKKGSSQDQFEIIGQKNASQSKYEDVLTKGTSLIKILINTNNNTVGIDYNPNMAQMFVNQGLNFAQARVNYGTNTPNCTVHWLSDEKDRSTLRCDMLVYDMNDSRAIKFIQIAYDPDNSPPQGHPQSEALIFGYIYTVLSLNADGTMNESNPPFHFGATSSEIKITQGMIDRSASANSAAASDAGVDATAGSSSAAYIGNRSERDSSAAGNATVGNGASTGSVDPAAAASATAAVEESAAAANAGGATSGVRESNGSGTYDSGDQRE